MRLLSPSYNENSGVAETGFTDQQYQSQSVWDSCEPKITISATSVLSGQEEEVER